MKRYLISINLLWLFLPALAQTDTTERMVEINEVVIAESKFEGLKSRAAQHTYVINSKDLKRMNAQSTADVLTMSGQVFVQKSQQGGGSPMLRGFEASRVLLVVDGVRMNNIQYRAGHLQNVISVDNNVLERVEVLFGPSSTVYGSDALGGVVHMRTRTPMLAYNQKFLSKGNAMFRYGSVNNELTGHIDLNFGGRKFASLTSATFSRFGDLRQGNYTTKGTAGYWDRNYYQGRTNVYDSVGNVTGQKDTAIANRNKSIQVGSGFWQYDLLQKFLFQQTEDISHIVNLQFSNSSNIPRYDRLAVETGNSLKDAEWYYGPQTRLLALYDFNWKNAGPFNNISIGVNYQRLIESRNNRGFGKTWRAERTEKVHVAGFHADFKKNFKHDELTFGVEGQFNDLKSTAVDRNVNTDTIRAQSTRYPDGKNKMNFVAAYATHSWNWKDKVIISEGFRYNFINLHSTFTENSQDFFPLPYSEIKNRYHAVSGNFGVVAKPGAGFRIAGLFSTGFRAPNVDDIAKVFESVPGSVIVPNNKLKPEYTINGELTIEKVFLNRIKVSATGFGTYFLNAITTDVTQFNGQDSIDFDGTLSRVTTLVNKNKAYIAGVSTTMEGDITDWMSVYATFNYTYGRILTDSTPYPLDHIAPMYGRAGFRMQYKWVRGEFFSLFSGKKKVKDYNMLGEDNFGQATPDGMPAWYTLNLRIGFQPVKQFSIDLGCDNLLDLRYRQFASGVSAPGRNFFVTARVSW